MDKRILRSAIKRIRQSTASEALECDSKKITAILLDLPQVKKADCIMAYLAIAGEVNLDSFIEECLTAGKRVVVPITRLKEKQLDISEVEMPLDGLEKGPMGIREPNPAGRRYASADDIDLAVVPGVAFDLHGGRLGYGGGFYDRFIGGLRNKPPLIGVCCDFQVIEGVPMESCDRHMDGLATPGGFHWFRDVISNGS